MKLIFLSVLSDVLDTSDVFGVSFSWPRGSSQACSGPALGALQDADLTLSLRGQDKEAGYHVEPLAERALRRTLGHKPSVARGGFPEIRNRLGSKPNMPESAVECRFWSRQPVHCKRWVLQAWWLTSALMFSCPAQRPRPELAAHLIVLAPHRAFEDPESDSARACGPMYPLDSFDKLPTAL